MNGNWKRTNEYKPGGLSLGEVAEEMGITMHEAQFLEQQALRKLWSLLRNDEDIRDYAMNVLSINIDDHERYHADQPASYDAGVQLGLLFETPTNDTIQR